MELDTKEEEGDKGKNNPGKRDKASKMVGFADALNQTSLASKILIYMLRYFYLYCFFGNGMHSNMRNPRIWITRVALTNSYCNAMSRFRKTLGHTLFSVRNFNFV